MKVQARDYARLAREILARSPEMREAVIRGTVHFDVRRRAAYAEIDASRWKDWAARVKDHLLLHLDRYLVEAEAHLRRNGVEVHWAETPEDARAVLDGLVRRHGVRSVVKGKSMLSEELGVNALLESRGVQVLETDLGEYVIQLLGEPPSHILAPAVHRGLEEIGRLFHDVLGTPADAPPDALAAAARAVLRQAFLTADMGITGANFLVAETGTLALVENEGNLRLSTSLPRVHVALVGIEKLLPRATDLSGFLQLVARGATGQPVGTYVSLIQGPRREGEPDGPDEVHVVLVDNGRSALLGDPEAWETLRCIRCSACVNACPVYRQTGGHAYGWVYSGPIGAVLGPGLLGLEEGGPLAQASSLCGACYEACPVRIPIPKLLLEWRRRAVEAGHEPRAHGAVVAAWTRVMTSPRLYRAASRALRLLPGSAFDSRVLPVVKAWSAHRAGLRPSRRTFRELWKEGIR